MQLPSNLIERIPLSATNAESWILLQLFIAESIKASACRCGVSARRVRQVAQTHKIDISNY